jgi:threonine aldolase
MDYIDLRSDTVTQQTQAMREAILNATLGDDGYGEDPTVKRLEEMAAAICGKESALLVTSGAQGNQAAVLSWVGKGEEIICEANAHIYNNETGAIAALAGAQVRPVVGTHGVMTDQHIIDAIRPGKMNIPRTALICVENTHNFAGGTFYTPAQMADIRRVADWHGIPVHLDGARIFNAAVAQNISVAELTKEVDSVQFCLSKGLAAPVGSLLVGSHDFISRARRFRRMLGGGMRQAGIIAAAGIVALETMVDRLAEDHFHARRLAEKIAAGPLVVDLATIQTNIVIFGTDRLTIDAFTFSQRLLEKGVKVSAINRHQVRAVTHYGISYDDIERAADYINQVSQESA